MSVVFITIVLVSVLVDILQLAVGDYFIMPVAVLIAAVLAHSPNKWFGQKILILLFANVYAGMVYQIGWARH